MKNGILSAVEVLKKEIAEKSYVDIGEGAEIELKITKFDLQAAMKRLLEDGYMVRNVEVERATKAGESITVPILCDYDASYPNVIKTKIIESILSQKIQGV